MRPVVRTFDNGGYRMYKRIILSLYLVLITSISSAGELGKWENYIPKSGSAKADVMRLGAPAEIQNIGLRLQKAMKKDPQWFKSYISKSPAGKPLPYHKKFNLTEAEYSTYLAGINNEVKLTKSGQAKIKFSHDKAGEIKLSGLPGKPPHNVITYDIESNTIITAIAKTNKNSTIDQGNKKSATGRWKGEQWEYSEIQSETKYKSVKFAIGKLTDQAKNIIYYDVKLTVNGQPRKLSYILLYDAE